MKHSPKTGLAAAAGIFGVMATAQTVRLIVRPRITVAGRPFPLWPSAVAAVVLAGLSAWMWDLAREASD